MQKITYLVHSNVSNSETFIKDLIMSLAEAGHDIVVLSGAKRSSSTVPPSTKVKIIFTGYFEKAERLSYLAFSIGRIFKLTLGFKFKFFVQRSIAELNLKKYLLKERPRIVYIDYATTSVFILNLLQRLKISFIVHVHGYDVTSALADPVYKSHFLRMFISCKKIIAASHHIKRLLILEGCPEDKIEVIRYGIATSQIRPISWEERKKEVPSVIFLGRLTPKKNPIALIYAFKKVLTKVPNARLSIIGEGPMYKKVDELIEKLGVRKNISLLGKMKQEEAFLILKRQWVYAQHSVTSASGDQEGFALSLAEAAAYELPVVSTIHNGISEQVLDGVTGYLVQEFNYEAMGERIAFLLMHPEIAESMGKKGRENIKQLCDGKIRTERIRSLLFSEN